MVVGEWQEETGVKSGETNTFNSGEILISKDTPVTGFPHCDFIDAAYFLHAVAKVNIFSCSGNGKRYQVSNVQISMIISNISDLLLILLPGYC